LLRGLKRRLEKAKGTWADEVPRIVWAYHTTPQSTTKETPFSLVYGSDTMIPVEIQESLPRFQNFVAEESNEERKVNLDLSDEVREEARIKAEALKRRVKYKYNSKLRPWQFQVTDLVMRKAPYQLENKLSPKWTGPFRVTEALGNGAYKLETLEGDNSSNLEQSQPKVLFQLIISLYTVKGTLFFSYQDFLMRSTNKKLVEKIYLQVCCTVQLVNLSLVFISQGKKQ